MSCGKCESCSCGPKEFKVVGTITDDTPIISPDVEGGSLTVGELRAKLLLTIEKQTAIRQYLAKPPSYGYACGCMGQATLPGYEDKPWGPERKVEPLCRCAMRMVERVNDNYYLIDEVRSPNGIKVEAKFIGPVGGPYLVDAYGRDI
jgi:hypothetical protein